MIDTLELCYVASPYSGDTELDIEQNILNSRKAVIRLIQKYDGKYFPVTPNLCTMGFHHYEEICNLRPDYWLDGDLILLSHCHVIYLAPGWEHSKGCRLEAQRALDQNITIIFTGEDVLRTNPEIIREILNQSL